MSRMTSVAPSHDHDITQRSPISPAQPAASQGNGGGGSLVAAPLSTPRASPYMSRVGLAFVQACKSGAGMSREVCVDATAPALGDEALAASAVVSSHIDPLLSSVIREGGVRLASIGTLRDPSIGVPEDARRRAYDHGPIVGGGSFLDAAHQLDRHRLSVISEAQFARRIDAQGFATLELEWGVGLASPAPHCASQGTTLMGGDATTTMTTAPPETSATGPAAVAPRAGAPAPAGKVAAGTAGTTTTKAAAPSPATAQGSGRPTTPTTAVVPLPAALHATSASSTQAGRPHGTLRVALPLAWPLDGCERSRWCLRHVVAAVSQFDENSEESARPEATGLPGCESVGSAGTVVASSFGSGASPHDATDAHPPTAEESAEVQLEAAIGSLVDSFLGYASTGSTRTSPGSSVGGSLTSPAIPAPAAATSSGKPATAAGPAVAPVITPSSPVNAADHPAFSCATSARLFATWTPGIRRALMEAMMLQHCAGAQGRQSVLANCYSICDDLLLKGGGGKVHAAMEHDTTSSPYDPRPRTSRSPNALESGVGCLGATANLPAASTSAVRLVASLAFGCDALRILVSSQVNSWPQPSPSVVFPSPRASATAIPSTTTVMPHVTEHHTRFPGSVMNGPHAVNGDGDGARMHGETLGSGLPVSSLMHSVREIRDLRALVLLQSALGELDAGAANDGDDTANSMSSGGRTLDAFVHANPWLTPGEIAQHAKPWIVAMDSDKKVAIEVLCGGSRQGGEVTAEQQARRRALAFLFNELESNYQRCVALPVPVFEPVPGAWLCPNTTQLPTPADVVEAWLAVKQRLLFVAPLSSDGGSARRVSEGGAGQLIHQHDAADVRAPRMYWGVTHPAMGRLPVKRHSFVDFENRVVCKTLPGSGGCIVPTERFVDALVALVGSTSRRSRHSTANEDDNGHRSSSRHTTTRTQWDLMTRGAAVHERVYRKITDCVESCVLDASFAIVVDELATAKGERRACSDRDCSSVVAGTPCPDLLRLHHPLLFSFGRLTSATTTTSHGAVVATPLVASWRAPLFATVAQRSTAAYAKQVVSLADRLIDAFGLEPPSPSPTTPPIDVVIFRGSASPNHATCGGLTDGLPAPAAVVVVPWDDLWTRCSLLELEGPQASRATAAGRRSSGPGGLIASLTTSGEMGDDADEAEVEALRGQFRITALADALTRNSTTTAGTPSSKSSVEVVVAIRQRYQLQLDALAMAFGLTAAPIPSALLGADVVDHFVKRVQSLRQRFKLPVDRLAQTVHLVVLIRPWRLGDLSHTILLVDIISQRNTECRPEGNEGVRRTVVADAPMAVALELPRTVSSLGSNASTCSKVLLPLAAALRVPFVFCGPPHSGESASTWNDFLRFGEDVAAAHGRGRRPLRSSASDEKTDSVFLTDRDPPRHAGTSSGCRTLLTQAHRLITTDEVLSLVHS